MRRTGKTSFSPMIGIVIAGIGNSGFGADCAWAEALCVAAPASANAPDARMLLRSTISIMFPLCFCDSVSNLTRGARQDGPIPPGPHRERQAAADFSAALFPWRRKDGT